MPSGIQFSATFIQLAPLFAAAICHDAIRRLATTLNVTADLLVFDADERGPDDDLRLAFEAIDALDPDDKAHVQAVLEGLLLRHQAKRITKAS